MEKKGGGFCLCCYHKYTCQHIQYKCIKESVRTHRNKYIEKAYFLRVDLSL